MAGLRAAQAKLAEAGKDVRAVYDPTLMSALHLAAFGGRGGHADVIAWLCADAGLDPNHMSDFDPPIHLAARFGYIEPALALLRCGADPQTHNVHKATPAEWARQYGHEAFARAIESHMIQHAAPEGKGWAYGFTWTPPTVARTLAELQEHVAWLWEQAVQRLKGRSLVEFIASKAGSVADSVAAALGAPRPGSVTNEPRNEL